MKPHYENFNVRTHCPDCNGAYTTFEGKNQQDFHGSLIKDGLHTYKGREFTRILYILTRCAGCGRAGLAVVHDDPKRQDSLMEEFFPASLEQQTIPELVPDGIRNEYREAERCASVGARRGAVGLLRSALEKTLRANGYIDGSLSKRIDEIAKDGLITDARRSRAHEDIRLLGNDVLHEDWRPVTSEEVEAGLHYVQRILEDFYDERATVEQILVARKRILATVPVINIISDN